MQGTQATIASTAETAAHEILGLGHIGLYVTDLARSVAFWQELFGFQVTDGSVGAGFIFLSTRPEEEHHMMLLRGGRTAAPDALLVQQVSFRCAGLATVMRLSHRLRAAGVPTMDVSHGNAVGVYFRDPDGNRCEVYWQTGVAARQVFKKAVNLDESEQRIVKELREHAAQYGETGYNEDTPFLLKYPPVEPDTQHPVPAE